MKNSLHRKKLLPSILLMGSTLFTACVNDDYDFNEVDMTLGLGGSSLSIPTSSTDTIKLIDVLDPEETEWIKVLPNGDYYLELEGDDAEPVYPEVDKIHFKKTDATSYDLPISLASDDDEDSDDENKSTTLDDIDLSDIDTSTLTDEDISSLTDIDTSTLTDEDISSLTDIDFSTLTDEEIVALLPDDLTALLPEDATGTTITRSLSGDGIVQIFTYTGERPEEVLELISGRATCDLDFTLYFTETFKMAISTIDQLTITMPSYMTLTNGSSNAENYTFSGTTFHFTDVTTSQNLTIHTTITEFNFENEDDLGSLHIDQDSISFDGNVYVSMDSEAEIDLLTLYAADIDAESLYNMTLPSTLEIGDIIFDAGSGRFNPIIDLYDLGEVEVTDVPDILTDGSVVCDLYNPQIAVSIQSDLTLGGYVQGKIVAYKDDAVLTEFDVPELKINANGSTKICLCLQPDAVPDTFDQVEAVPGLSELIRTIPDKINFLASARADTTIVTSFELGHQYNVLPYYAVRAPLAFGEEARVVYKDTLDGWNSDVKDLEMTDNTSIVFTANIENRIPLYLNVEAYAIDVDGNIMQDDFSIDADNTIIASADSETSVTTPLTITITQKETGAMKRLDGIIFMASADASNGENSIAGETLNANKHFLIATDVTISINGMIIADMN